MGMQVFEKDCLLVTKALKIHFNQAHLFMDYLKILLTEEKIEVVIMVLVFIVLVHMALILYKMVALKVLDVIKVFIVKDIVIEDN